MWLVYVINSKKNLLVEAVSFDTRNAARQYVDTVCCREQSADSAATSTTPQTTDSIYGVTAEDASVVMWRRRATTTADGYVFSGSTVYAEPETYCRVGIKPIGDGGDGSSISDKDLKRFGQVVETAIAQRFRRTEAELLADIVVAMDDSTTTCSARSCRDILRTLVSAGHLVQIKHGAVTQYYLPCELEFEDDGVCDLFHSIRDTPPAPVVTPLPPAPPAKAVAAPSPSYDDVITELTEALRLRNFLLSSSAPGADVAPLSLSTLTH